jgi:predicted esterase
MLPVAMGRASRDGLLALGVPTPHREYEMAHEIRPEALRDLVDWLDTKVLRRVLV